MSSEYKPPIFRTELGHGCSGRSMAAKSREQTGEQTAPEVMGIAVQSTDWLWKHVSFLSSFFSFSEQWQGWDSGHTRAADYQRARRFGNFKILEMLIPFGSCFKGQTNGAPVSGCGFCQNSRDNICAHPGLKISCQRMQLLKWAKQNSCIIEIHLSNI